MSCRVADDIVKYLRSKGGVASIGQSPTSLPAELRGYSCQTIGGNLRVLTGAGIICITAPPVRGWDQRGSSATHYSLAEEYWQGETWREVFRSFKESRRIKVASPEPQAESVSVATANSGEVVLDPLTEELIKVHQWASRVRDEIFPLKKRNETLEEKLHAAEVEIERLTEEVAEAQKTTVRHRENERIAEQRLEILRRDNAMAMSGAESKIFFDHQGVQIEKASRSRKS